MSPLTRLAAALSAIVVAALSLPAGAETTVVTGVVGSSVAISTPPSAAADFGALAIGLNTVSAGTVTITANTAYTVTVEADRPAMTAWDGASYGAAALGTPLALVPTLTGGAPVLTSVAAVGTVAQTFMTGTGLTTDSAGLQLQQTVLVGDTPGTYRTVLTYTAAPSL